MCRCRLMLPLMIVLALGQVGAGYQWTLEQTPIPLGPSPSMTLMGNVLPILSNGSEVLGRTPSAWQPISVSSGWIAGNEGTLLVSNNQPVKYGKDGSFYSTMVSGGTVTGTVWQNNTWVSTGMSFPLSGSGWGISSSDPQDRPYLAYGNSVATFYGGNQTGTSFLFSQISDLAVSSFGDIAVSGTQGSQSGVNWFNYKAGQWCFHPLAGVIPSSSTKIAIEFDDLGNLGVAYVTSSRELRFSYLDLGQDYWVDQAVTRVVGDPALLGTTLAFDRLNRPVIAAGQTLAYNPFSVLPGDANFDGNVDVGDLGILAANYGRTGTFMHQGDFNSDGSVDVGDLGILAANYGTSTDAAISIPEPISISLMFLGGLSILRRKIG